jgi:hypothetical protein
MLFQLFINAEAELTMLEELEKFLLLPVRISEDLFKIGAIAYSGIAFLVFFLFIISFTLWRLKIAKPKKDDFIETYNPKDSKGTNEPVTQLSNGNFGKIIDKDFVMCDGKKLKYFMIKDKTNKAETLPVGTIAIILKRNSKEAHVRAATTEEIKSLKKKGLVA